jgi:hypothetical protein
MSSTGLCTPAFRPLAARVASAVPLWMGCCDARFHLLEGGACQLMDSPDGMFLDEDGMRCSMEVDG